MSDGGVVELDSRRRRKPGPKGGDRTEIEIAEMVIAASGDELRFCADLGGWHVWTGTNWARDERQRARECVKAIARKLADDSAKKLDQDLFRAAKRAASSLGTSSILAVMQSDPRIVFAPNDANRDPWLLNARNGTVDLRTGELRPHDRRDLITRCAAAAYVPGAPAPRFDAFLAEVQPDPEVRAYLRRVFGYSACGVVREHVLVVLWGPGANGKSVLAEIIMHALGDYAKPAPPSLIVEQHHAHHPTDIASCLGSRLVVVHETRRGASFDASKVKQLTGGDRLEARFMRQDFFTFTPSHTLVMLSNYRPEADATDAALWRRINLVPFAYVVPEDRRDPALAETIKREEIDGALAWIVGGCVDWQARGLAPPTLVLAQTESYRAAEDTIAAFLAERCVAIEGARVKAGALYEAFASWCKATGARVASGRDFAAEIIGRGYERKETGAGRFYIGLGVRADDAEASGGREQW